MCRVVYLPPKGNYTPCSIYTFLFFFNFIYINQKEKRVEKRVKRVETCRKFIKKSNNANYRLLSNSVSVILALSGQLSLEVLKDKMMKNLQEQYNRLSAISKLIAMYKEMGNWEKVIELTAEFDELNYKLANS